MTRQPTTPEEILAGLSRTRPLESKALKARRALEALRDEIGSRTWIEKAIISCDALDWGKKLDENGRPLRNDGSIQTWKSMGI